MLRIAQDTYREFELSMRKGPLDCDRTRGRLDMTMLVDTPWTQTGHSYRQPTLAHVGSLGSSEGGSSH
jgi:hypothetical protein